MTEHDYRQSLEWELGIDHGKPDADKLLALAAFVVAAAAMREVKIGYAIKTPFKLPDGDSIGLYVRRDEQNPRMLRLEDDGGTIAALEEDGVSFSSEARSDVLADLLKQYDAHYDDAASTIFTEYVDESRLPANFVKFMALMLRLQDLRMLAQDRVREVFKDDVRRLVIEQLASAQRGTSP